MLQVLLLFLLLYILLPDYYYLYRPYRRYPTITTAVTIAVAYLIATAYPTATSLPVLLLFVLSQVCRILRSPGRVGQVYLERLLRRIYLLSTLVNQLRALLVLLQVYIVTTDSYYTNELERGTVAGIKSYSLQKTTGEIIAIIAIIAILVALATHRLVSTLRICTLDSSHLMLTRITTLTRVIGAIGITSFITQIFKSSRESLTIRIEALLKIKISQPTSQSRQRISQQNNQLISV